MSPTKSSSGDKERRRYFRIDEEVLLGFKLLSEEEKLKQMQRIKSGEDLCPDLYHTFLMLESDIADLIKKAKKENPVLAQSIELLNRKLNVIAKGPPSEQNQHSLFDSPPVKVNISGCGIAFMSAQPIEKGQMVQVEIVLLPSKHYILSIAEVVSCERMPLSNNVPLSADKPHRIAVNYLSIRSEDTEKIIQHVIKREVEILRETKRHLSG